MENTYIIEVRNENGELDFKAKAQKKIDHPYLFSRSTFTLFKLVYYMSFGQDRDTAKNPADLPKFMKDIGISYRVKTW